MALEVLNEKIPSQFIKSEIQSPDPFKPSDKAVNREDKRSRRYRDRDFAKFERSRRYRDR